jgi:hypothetical protein
MTSLDNVLRQLREERDQAQFQVEKLQSAISTIEALETRGNANTTNRSRPKRRMSAAARRRIARAQRARWAKLRGNSKPAAGARTAERTAAKRTLSPEGRKRIAAAARARWARARAQQTKKAA